MKKTILLLLASITLFACAQNDINALYTKVLGGNHTLRKFNVKTTNSASQTAWYFLVMGGYSTSSTSSTKVRFYFLNYKGEYQLRETNLDKVNIKIDSTVTIPYVRFYYITRQDRSEENSSELYRDITRTVIYCKDSDFQPEININDLK